MATNFEPHERAVLVQSTKIKAIHICLSKRPGIMDM